jgi:hypothetical protein
MNPTNPQPNAAAADRAATTPCAAFSATQAVAASGSRILAEQLAQTIAQRLSAGSQVLAPDLETRLRFAREQALKRARTAAVDASTKQSLGGRTPWIRLRPSAGRLDGMAGQAASPNPWPAWSLRLLACLPLLVLVLGLPWVQAAIQLERAVTLAEMDAELLTSELHPVLYSDPAFAEYLRQPPP